MNLVYLFLHSCIIYYLTYWLLDPKPQTTQTGDRNKFSPLDSPYAPYPIPAWIAALQAVNQSPANLIEATKSMQHYGHYIFPDPGPIQTYTKFCIQLASSSSVQPSTYISGLHSDCSSEHLLIIVHSHLLLKILLRLLLHDEPLLSSWPRLSAFNLQPSTSQDFTRIAPVNTFWLSPTHILLERLFFLVLIRIE